MEKVKEAVIERPSEIPHEEIKNPAAEISVEIHTSNKATELDPLIVTALKSMDCLTKSAYTELKSLKSPND